MMWSVVKDKNTSRRHTVLITRTGSATLHLQIHHLMLSRFLRFCFIILIFCVGVGVCTWVQVPVRGRTQLSLELEWQVAVSCPMWVLGTELGPLREQVNTLSWWVIASAPTVRFFLNACDLENSTLFFYSLSYPWPGAAHSSPGLLNALSVCILFPIYIKLFYVFPYRNSWSS